MSSRAAVTGLLAMSMFCAGVCGASVLAKGTTDSTKVAAEVKAAIHTQVAAYAAKDVAKAASIAAPDIVTMFHGGPNVVGKQAVIESMKEQMADPALKLAVSDETVDVATAGDMAVYRATYSFTFTDPRTKGPTTEIGNWVAVFKRQPDGSMKMATDMILDQPPN